MSGLLWRIISGVHGTGSTLSLDSWSHQKEQWIELSQSSKLKDRVSVAMAQEYDECSNYQMAISSDTTGTTRHGTSDISH